MSTQESPGSTAVVMVPVLPPRRHAFGWPPGSIRAILVLIVVALTCALMLLTRTQRGTIIAIPPYLLYLLFMAVGYYFAARGHGKEVHKDVPPPLWLPAGSIRLIIMAALTATIAYKVVTDRDGLMEQLRASAQQLDQQPVIPVVILGAFFAGVLFRALVIGKHERSPWAQDLEAWVALIGILLMGIAALIHLVINPTLLAGNMVTGEEWEAFLAGIVALYFGLRT
jgi:hypothetical protein